MSYSAFLKWLIIFVLILFGSTVSAVTGLVDVINQSDVTKISFLIYGLFMVSSIRVGRNTWKYCNQCFVSQRRIDNGWFISNTLLTLGMIGTVIGFIIMIQCFNTFDPNTGNVMHLFAQVATGLGTALYTTATGLVCSLMLKIQIHNLEDCIAKQKS